MRFRKRESKRLSLDITPLIDVIFLLLIFFMVSTTFIEAPGIKVNLPEAAVKPSANFPDSLEVTITEKNGLYLNGQQIKKEHLANAFFTAKKKAKVNQIIIKADGSVRHDLVVFVMDAAHSVGVTKISIATRNKIEK